ncbi:MAG: glycerol-3-phosphate dehydrogenase/oxidase [Corynebacterium sp.]|uniref:glycerol-3-phosphate dehydrogenase/oxidase n=1 Tax=Corynebacterium sp. TaxID=1720 RepID=UPI0026DB04EA|nr:glycerol-3-phosphate dehydrogenase/oxidase [Corynebacterium sp.]MDO5097384.1 glycerol-3-phosphate dehydrogenase/oxidase [Corynebacterium sp.]
MSSTTLNAHVRTNWWDELSNNPEVDLLVVGAGITGVGVALDAATRGLRVLVVDQRDLAHGTSRFSSKLVHGGLRYLAKGEVKIAFHSAKERRLLMEVIAPHLVSALPQVTLVGPDTNLLQKAAVRLGFWAGDVLRLLAGTKSATLPRSRFVGRREALALCPAANPNGLKGAFVNFDGQMIDDARLVTAVARTAVGAGAKILTYVSALNVSGTGAELVDEKTGARLTITAKAVVNAAGVWAGQVDPGINLRTSRGTHLVIPADRLGNPTGALTVPLPGSISRFVFAMPEQLGRVYLGLTDVELDGDIPEVPEATKEDEEFLLAAFNRALATDLTEADVVGAFAGLRPLIDSGESKGSADLSRKHAVVESETGVISVVGGKFTEYRLMAQETVDEVIRRRQLPAGPCRTHAYPLVGAPGHSESQGKTAADHAGLPESLIARYGLEARMVVDRATIDRPLEKVAGLDVTRAEVEFAITHEGALDADDVVDRRTRIGLVPADREAALAEVAAIVAEVSC